MNPAADLRLQRGPLWGEVVALHRELLAEIERASTAALGEMRTLVSVLRDPVAAPLTEPYSTLPAAVLAAVGDDTAVSLRLAPGLAEVLVPPEVVSTAHRVVLETLTNVRKHAPTAGEIGVAATPVAKGRSGWARIEIRNDGVRQGRIARRSGYGLVGMRERVETLGGELEVGSWGDRCWHVMALLPVPLPDGPVAPLRESGAVPGEKGWSG